jgi:hypothetical protein
MPRLPYRPQFFGRGMGPLFSDGYASEITFSWEELCRAAITVGRRSWEDVVPYGTYSFLEALWRLAMLRANVVLDSDGRLRKSEAFKNLERSEKGAVSFFFGNMFSKLLADKLFDVPWLLHVDRYASYLNPVYRTDRRPDFVGMDTSREWLVFEAKGRAAYPGDNVMQRAKQQTGSLRTINGQLPKLRVAAASYFSNDRLRARLWDPTEHDDDAPDLPLSATALLREYYAPLMDFVLSEAVPHRTVELGSKAQEKRIVFAQLPGLDAELGIDAATVDWYRSEDPANILIDRLPKRSSMLSRIAEFQAIPEAQRDALLGSAEGIVPLDWTRGTEVREEGLDTVRVSLGQSWSDDVMQRQPGDRGRT